MESVTIGVDLGDRYSRYCVIDGEARVLEEGRLKTTPEALSSWLSRQDSARVVMEVGTHSPWASEVAQGKGHEVFVGNPRELKLIYGRSDKSDRLDAEHLARIGRTTRLRQLQGIGALTALAYVLTLECPERFRTSRAVGSYLGLRPRKRQSGKQDPALGITKAGDQMLRRLLVGSAHYILGPFGQDCDLRRWGLQLVARGGPHAKKKAAVAVARKLAVLLHRLWVSGGDYDPLFNADEQHPAVSA